MNCGLFRCLLCINISIDVRVSLILYSFLSCRLFVRLSTFSALSHSASSSCVVGVVVVRFHDFLWLCPNFADWGDLFRGEMIQSLCSPVFLSNFSSPWLTHSIILSPFSSSTRRKKPAVRVYNCRIRQFSRCLLSRVYIQMAIKPMPMNDRTNSKCGFMTRSLSAARAWILIEPKITTSYEKLFNSQRAALPFKVETRFNLEPTSDCSEQKRLQVFTYERIFFLSSCWFFFCNFVC